MIYFVYKFELGIWSGHSSNMFNLHLERELNKIELSIVMNTQITWYYISRKIKNRILIGEFGIPSHSFTY